MPSDEMQLRANVIETVRAYCESEGVSAYIWVQLDDACRVPRDYAQGNVIVLDISELAVNRFAMGAGWLTFQARFGEENAIETIEVPLNRIALAAPETDPKLGVSFMVFPTSEAMKQAHSGKVASASTADENVRPVIRRPTRVK